MDVKDLKIGFDQLLSADTIIRRQKRTEKNKDKSLFLSIIKKYEDQLLKSTILEAQFSLDLSKYEDPFFSIIDDVMLLSWGEGVYQLIAFYLYERVNIDDGSENFIVGEDNSEIFIRTPEQLYQTICKLYPGTFA